MTTDPTLAELVENLDQAERAYRIARAHERELYDQWLAARATSNDAGVKADDAREAYCAGRANARPVR